MRRKLQKYIVPIQILVTLSVCLNIYMILALLDYQGGIDGFMGLLIFQPIIGTFISWISVIICFLLGIPIRLNKKLNNWWKKYPIISLLIFVTGMILFIASFTSSFTSEIVVNEKFQHFKTLPDFYMLAIGYFFICFGLLHFYPKFSCNSTSS